ncbi:MAG: acyl-ACP desaturase [Planctomycetes bacterium]|nr:acyl-ACP desaturase [Planctomycetota bacterium]
MSTTNELAAPEVEGALWRIYRDFFDAAERKRRWRIRDDIPWDQCNPHMDPAIADVVETFCAVELYLPDYVGKVLPIVRQSKGRTWFYANWGYEESKHSLALSDWLLRSGHRTEEYMFDMERKVFEREWNLPVGNALGMLAYAMAQEHATFINYRNLKQRVIAKGGDPALEKVLGYISVDEAAHTALFRSFLELFLQVDRDSTLEALRLALNRFQMPAIHDLLDESQKRISRIRELELFNEEIFMRDVYNHFLETLGVTKAEMRGRKPKKSMASA